ncbi:transposase family protein, partial [Acidithiobacillus ferriphilus]|uniref:DDE-type integrase/transposase/recombinase n=1 Tax=Acidithiobacillus ferriphilus TaxID=1689834 RepID=UPI001C068FFE
MTFLPLNQLLEFTEDGHTERVLWFDAEDHGYVCIDIHSVNANPLYRHHVDTVRLIETGVVHLRTDDPFLTTMSEDRLSPTQRAKRTQRYARIATILDRQPEIFDLRKRGKLIAEAVVANGESRHSLLRLLRCYWQRGMTPNALLPDYANSGAPGRDRAATGKRRGRPPKNAESSANVTPETRAIFKAAVTKYYGMHPVFELTECYHAMLRAYFSDPVVDPDNGRQEWVLRPDAPSWWQFRYWYKKDNDVFDLKRRRVSSRVYDKDMRALTGTAVGETIGPGSRYLIDATIADIYLVSRYFPDKIVGRPVVYVVIDVFSRMITGLHVGFEGPSWVGAMQALANAVLDKTDYCTRFGVAIDGDDWPCLGMPDAILGDRGEMVGQMVETLIQNFAVRIETSAPYRADWKGVVEQQFRLLPARFKAYTPGYIQEDYRQRGGTDYRLDATLNIDEFTRIMIYCVRYYNTQHRIKEYALAPE